MLFHHKPSEAEELSNMLNLLDDQPERHDEIAEWINVRFGRDFAVLILDMSGFSRTTREKGIVTFLRKINEMQQIVFPIVQERGGYLVNTFADSLTCLFPTVDAAVRAAVKAMETIDVANLDRAADEQFHIAVGIGYGRILVVGDRDIFGDQVNVAAKLGEDIAEGDEILITDAAVPHLTGDVQLDWRDVTISGLPLRYAALVRKR